MGNVTEIYRHPIKAHGVEALTEASLSVGMTIPWDRHWAVAHEASKADGSKWVPCANFSRGSKAPHLVALKAKLNEDDKSVTLSHPDRKDFTFQPDDERQLSGFLAWVKPLMPENRAQSARIISSAGHGYTDFEDTSISINNHASLRDFSAKIGQDLSPFRFRGNIWVDGMDAWSEHDLAGKNFRIGTAEFLGTERIERCLATTANPDSGERDADTLGTLKSEYGHQDFGIYARVVKAGKIAMNDELVIL